MQTWRLSKAKRRLDEVIHHASCRGPQRVHGRDGDVVVLSAREYARLACDADAASSGRTTRRSRSWR